MSTEDDVALLERWCAGDLAAGNALFERYFDPVHAFFEHKVHGDAGDLVQRTFLACLEGKDRLRNAASFRSFLFAIARFELFDHWRGRRKDITDVANVSLAALGTSPTGALLKRAEHRLLLEGLRSLELDLQIALELHYWEQLRTHEIADVLSIPEGTVKSRLRRAREALVENLERIERDPSRLATTLASLDAWAASLRDALHEKRSQSGE